MRNAVIVVLVLALAAGCSGESEVGSPEWATVSRIDDRGGWGCTSGVLTESGLALSNRNCTQTVGTRICVQAIHSKAIGPDHYWWEPATGCGDDITPTEDDR